MGEWKQPALFIRSLGYRRRPPVLAERGEGCYSSYSHVIVRISGKIIRLKLNSRICEPVDQFCSVNPNVGLIKVGLINQRVPRLIQVRYRQIAGLPTMEIGAQQTKLTRGGKSMRVGVGGYPGAGLVLPVRLEQKVHFFSTQDRVGVPANKMLL